MIAKDTVQVNGKTIYLRGYKVNTRYHKYTSYTVSTVKAGSYKGIKGVIRKEAGWDGYRYRLIGRNKYHGAGKGLTRKEAVTALLKLKASTERAKKKAALTRETKCTCREPKTHLDCQYCGMGWWGEVVCGVCKEKGIEGKLIPGTGRYVCKLHREKKEKSNA